MSLEVAMEENSLTSFQHHHENCEFCQHWKEGTYYRPRQNCPCKDFCKHYGKWVLQQKPDWANGTNEIQPNTCLCCDVHEWFERNPTSYTNEISDSSWNPVWKNLSEQLKKELAAALPVTITTCTASQSTAEQRSPANQSMAEQ